MPNMFGEDQMHPSYAPYAKQKGDIVRGNIVYRKREDGYYDAEDINGSTWVVKKKDIPKK